jgi:hypothetical protein
LTLADYVTIYDCTDMCMLRDSDLICWVATNWHHLSTVQGCRQRRISDRYCMGGQSSHPAVLGLADSRDFWSGDISNAKQGLCPVDRNFRFQYFCCLNKNLIEDSRMISSLSPTRDLPGICC